MEERAHLTLLHVLEGHTDSDGDKHHVRSTAWSPDGKSLASGSVNGTVHLWDPKSGVSLILKGHEAVISSVAWSPDSKWLASSSYDETLRLWDATTGELLLILNGHEGQVFSVAWSPDGKYLASGSHDKTVRLWDATTGKLLLILNGHQGAVRSVGWSPDNKQIASGANDRTVRLWSATTGKPLHTLKKHEDFIRLVAWSPDGKQIASGSHDKTVRLWDAATGELLHTLENHKNQVCSVAWFPSGPLLASVSCDSGPSPIDTRVYFWRTDTWDALAELKDQTGYMHSSWHPNLPLLATVGQREGAIAIWRLDWEKGLSVASASRVRDMAIDAYLGRNRAYAAAMLQGKRDRQEFDVFLCHNGQDKTVVKHIGEQLKRRGILPWLDEWELPPGLPWQRHLEQQITQIKTAAVFVGKDGLGPWQQEELDAFLRQFVRRGCPVIPVLLPDIPKEPELPPFLENRTWVDFRLHNPDPMLLLLWGITGRREVCEWMLEDE
jgi:hypothetical protein